MERIFDIQGFSWWESDDIYKWPNDSFYQGENIDVRKNLSWVQLSAWLVDTWRSISWTITYMENLENFWLSWILICTDTWNIYLNWTLKFTLATWTTAWNRVYWVWSLFIAWTQYLYFISWDSSGAWKIHKVNTNITLNTASHRAYTCSSWSNQKVIVLQRDAFRFLFWKSNNIIEIEDTEIVTDRLKLPSNEFIIWFTEFQSNYKIYSNVWTVWMHTFRAYWEKDPSYRQQLKNQPILWVVNDWAYDYAILWYSLNYSDLYLISWTQKQELRVNLEASENSRVLSWDLSIREWIVYISWWLSWESNKYWVYTYGNYYPWTPKSLVQEYWINWTQQFTYHCHTINISYYACNDWKVYKSDCNNPPANWYATSWYVVSKLYEGNLWEEKVIKKIKIWFELETATSFKIYLRKNIWDTFLLAKTVDSIWTNNYDWKKSLIIYENEIKSLWLWIFNTIQVKIELFRWTSWYKTKKPVVKRITLFMDTVNDK